MSDMTGDASASPNDTALPVPAAERTPTGQFLPGRSGNPLGRPRGLRSGATLLAESMLNGDTESIFGKLLSRARKGNMAALKFCGERIVPRMTSRPVDIELPQVNTLRDILDAHTALIDAMSRGEVDPAQAKTMALLLDLKRKSLESIEFEQRVVAMEEHMTKAMQFRGRGQ